MGKNFRRQPVRRRSSVSANTYSQLEDRRLLAGISLESVNGFATVVIDGTSAADIALVQQMSAESIRVTLNAQQEVFSTSAVERIRFLGHSGNDAFTNQTEISSAAYGHGGDDTLRGGNGHNRLQGGDGNDGIYGGPRNDQLRGRDGNDFIDSGLRHDRVFGGNGDDTVAASQGNDVILGEAGNDTLHGGDGDDEIHGGSGNDLIEFGPGSDEFAVFQNDFGDYLVTASAQTISVQSHAGTDGNDTIFSAQTLRFSNVDRAVADFQVSLNAAEEISLQLLNQLRSSRGLSALSVVADLSAYSEHWSRDTLPDDFRHSTFSEVEHLFVNGRNVIGENIVFIGSSSLSPAEAAESFHDLWVDSPTHFDNMIDPQWTEIGVGLVQLSSGWYGTHNFSNS